MTGYHAVLGMHAFGLEETGDYVPQVIMANTAAPTRW